MLVLTIKPLTFVTLGPDIVIHNLQQETIRIGIEAPKDVRIDRHQ